MSSSRQTLNSFISERLGVAASDICVEVTELLAPLAEQNHQSRKELERLNRLLATVHPNMRLDGTDTMHHHHHPMRDVEVVSRSPRLLKEEPQHLQLKEELHHTPME